MRQSGYTHERLPRGLKRYLPMVCFVNIQSVDRVINSIFQRFNLEWKSRTLSVFTQLEITQTTS